MKNATSNTTAKTEKEIAAQAWADIWADASALKEVRKFDFFVENGAPYIVEDLPYGGSKRVYLPEAYTPEFMEYSELTGRYLRRGYKLPCGQVISIRSFKALTKASCQALGLKWDNSNQKFYKTVKTQLKRNAMNGWPVLNVNMSKFDYDFLNLLIKAKDGKSLANTVFNPVYVGYTQFGRTDILDQIDFLSVRITTSNDAYFSPNKGLVSIGPDMPKAYYRENYPAPTEKEIKRIKEGKSIDRLGPAYYMSIRPLCKNEALTDAQKEFISTVKKQIKDGVSLSCVIDGNIEKYNTLK